MELKVGDKVRLVGEWWELYAHTLKVGDIVTVTRVDENGKAWAGLAGEVLNSCGGVMRGYEIERVEDARPIHTLASVTEGIRELIGVLESTGIDPEDAKSIIMSNIEARL